MRLKIESRCKAKLPEGEHLNYHGRCDLNRGHDGPHILERGMDKIQFEIRVIKRERKPPPPPPKEVKVKSDEAYPRLPTN